MRDYRGGEHQNSPYSFNVAPTYLQDRLTLGIEDYGLKCRTKMIEPFLSPPLVFDNWKWIFS
jgi:hypothetical protein